MKASDRDSLLVRLDENVKSLHQKIDSVTGDLSVVTEKQIATNLDHSDTKSKMKIMMMAVFSLYGLLGTALIAAYYK